MLYFWINGLETTEEECFTQQYKVFVSVFSISFSLAGYLVFNSANPLRVRLRSYTNYRHSSLDHRNIGTKSTEIAARCSNMKCLNKPDLIISSDEGVAFIFFQNF